MSSMEAVRAATKSLLGATSGDVGEQAEAVLSLLSQECDRIERQSNGYPRAPIRGDVWFDGAELGTRAQSVADFLRQRGDFEREERARLACCRAVLAVQSHYQNIVGPVMLARADCNERLGRTDLARKLYDAVIADFRWLVDDFEAHPESFPDDEVDAIGSLARAIEARLRLQPPSPDDLTALLARATQAIAARNPDT